MKTSVVVYSRRECHLCEIVESLVKEVQQVVNFDLDIIYIDGNPALEKVYGEEVPVTTINGQRHDYFQIDARRFRMAIERSESKNQEFH